QVMLAGLAPLLRLHRNPSVRSARAEGIMAADSRESTNRICKQTAPQVIQSSKIEYCNAPLQSCRSMAWQFFTADNPLGRAISCGLLAHQVYCSSQDDHLVSRDLGWIGIFILPNCTARACIVSTSRFAS